MYIFSLYIYSLYICMYIKRERNLARELVFGLVEEDLLLRLQQRAAYVSIRQHTSAYVSICLVEKELLLRLQQCKASTLVPVKLVKQGL